MEDSFDTTLMECNSRALKELKETTLLSGSDFKKLDICLPFAQNAFNKVQMFRTSTEMRISVLNDVNFPTTDSKYWQSIREMDCMFTQLVNLSFQYKEKMLDLEEAEIKLESLNDTFERRRAELNIAKIKFGVTCIQREAHHRIREIDLWREIQHDLVEIGLKAGIDDVNDHQLLSYTFRFLREYQIMCEADIDTALESHQNLVAHVRTSLNRIKELGLENKLLEYLKGDPGLMKFMQKEKMLCQGPQ